jgi:hypothetical protein
MAIFAIAIQKNTSFRGVQQLFNNVYHFSGTLPDATQAGNIAAFLKTHEQQFHSTDVGFNFYRCWSAGGSAGSNQMIGQGALTGVGTQTTDGNMDRERAVLIRYANGVDSRGRPVYLRKWYHSCGSCVGVSMNAAGVLANTAQISSANRTTIQNAADDILSPTISGQSYNLCSPSGTAGGTPVICHPYLEHHQLGDMWR